MNLGITRATLEELKERVAYIADWHIRQDIETVIDVYLENENVVDAEILQKLVAAVDRANAPSLARIKAATDEPIIKTYGDW